MKGKDTRLSRNDPEQSMTCWQMIASYEKEKTQAVLISNEATFAGTCMACRFLLQGIEAQDEPGVMVTFRHSLQDIRRRMSDQGSAINALEKQGLWRFVDASPQAHRVMLESGPFDLNALLARLRYAIDKISAKRIALDGLETIFDRFADRSAVWNEIARIVVVLQEMGLTVFMTTGENLKTDVHGCDGLSRWLHDQFLIIEEVPQNTPADAQCFDITLSGLPGSIDNHGSEVDFKTPWSTDDSPGSVLGYAAKQ